jgi:hypothetical protein
MHKQEFAKRATRRWRGFVAPDGTVWGPITNLYAFCREMGLEANNMRLVASGKYKSCKGWVLADEFDLMSAMPWEPPKVEYYLEDPYGRGYGPLRSSQDVRQAIKGRDLTLRSALMLLRGDVESVSGWRAQVFMGN